MYSDSVALSLKSLCKSEADFDCGSMLAKLISIIGSGPEQISTMGLTKLIKGKQ